MFARSAVSRLSARLSSAALRRDASTLVLAEAAEGKLSNSTLSAITAATKFGGPVTVLAPAAAAQAVSSVEGVSKVISVDDKAVVEGEVAENVTLMISQLQAAHKFTHIVASASNSGKNVIPRVAVKLDCAPVTDVIAIKGEDTFDRPMYAGNAIATVKTADPVKILTIRPTAFEKAKAGKASAPVEAFKASGSLDAGKAAFLSEEKVKSERPDLGSAPIVVAGGRALGSADNFKILYSLADKLGAAVGASRAAVDAGYVSNDLQVGQTGKVVAPQLYVAAGISGAIQHLAGMKDSKVIVAINKDAEAPIMQVADYGLVDDLFKAVPELTSKVPAK